MRMTRARLALLFWLLCASAPTLAGIDVQVTGLGSDERANVYTQIGILGYAKATDASHGEYDAGEVQRLFDQGEQDIRSALQPFGWYNPVIKSELRGTPPDWTAIYRVDAGPPTSIARVDVQLQGEGSQSSKVAEARRRLPLHAGERLKHTGYENAKAQLLQSAYDDGYLDATFTVRQLRIDVASNTAEIQLTLDTGPRYFFGSVAIVQDKHLDDAFLRRYVTIQPDQPFDSSKVLGTQFALTDLDYFRLVEVEPQKDKADAKHRVPVVIRVTSKAPRTYRVGAGYGTDTGVRGLVGVELRRLNDSGHKLRIDLRPSQNISTGIGEYRIPVGHTPGDSIGFNAQGLVEDVRDINEHLYSFGTNYNRVHSSWQQTEYLNYVRDAFAFSGEPQTVSRLLIPGISLSHTDVDDPIYPRSGWFGYIDVHGATSSLLSDSSFVQGLIRLRGVAPLGPSLRLLLRVEQGGSFVSKFDQFPTSQRFFAGGDESVRGYAYKSLGPRDDKGHVIGGKYLTTGSVEVDYDVWKNYGVAAFGDIGGADDVPNVRLHAGAGLGLRYRAPFGAIAIDLAHPLEENATPVHLHVGVRVGL
jgi:translocation and assembly module TamA